MVDSTPSNTTETVLSSSSASANIGKKGVRYFAYGEQKFVMELTDRDSAMKLLYRHRFCDELT